MYSSKIDTSITINVPIQKVYDLLTTPDKIPLIMPGLIEATNIPELPLVEGSTFNYKFQSYGMIYEGNWTVVKADSPTNYESKTDNPESDWRYALEDKGESTEVQLIIEYTASESILNKIKLETYETMNKKEAELFLQNLKTLLEMQS